MTRQCLYIILLVVVLAAWHQCRRSFRTTLAVQSSCVWRQDRCLPNSSIAESVATLCNKGSIPSALCEAIQRNDSPCAMARAGHYEGCNPYGEVSIERGIQLRRNFALAGCSSRLAAVLREGSLTVPQCPMFAPFTPTEILSLMRVGSMGGVLMTGDSMVRQIFTRLISFARGQDVASEHYFHSDAIFVVHRDGSDEFVVLNNMEGFRYVRRVLAKFFPMHRYKYAKQKTFDTETMKTENVVVAVLYQWDPRPSVFRRMFKTMRHTMQVASFMYHWREGEPLKAIDAYLKAVAIRQRSLNASFFFISAPPCVAFNESTLKMREWHIQRKLRGVPRTHWIDFGAVAKSGRHPRIDDFHFQCQWGPQFPRPAERLRHDGADCRDRMNLAAIQQWGYFLAVV